MQGTTPQMASISGSEADRAANHRIGGAVVETQFAACNLLDVDILMAAARRGDVTYSGRTADRRIIHYVDFARLVGADPIIPAVERGDVLISDVMALSVDVEAIVEEVLHDVLEKVFFSLS